MSTLNSLHSLTRSLNRQKNFFNNSVVFLSLRFCFFFFLFLCSSFGRHTFKIRHRHRGREREREILVKIKRVFVCWFFVSIFPLEQKQNLFFKIDIFFRLVFINSKVRMHCNIVFFSFLLLLSLQTLITFSRVFIDFLSRIHSSVFSSLPHD